MASSPEVLAEVVLGIGGVRDEQGEDAGTAYLYGGNEDQEDPCHQA
jgi:hypothetical protein